MTTPSSPTGPGEPLISVVIPSRNRVTVLRRTIPALLDQTLAATDYEVIVALDGSSDGSAAYLADLANASLVVVERFHRGRAAARNAGIGAARGRIVLFLDDDVIADKALLESHLREHRASGKAVVIGRLEVAAESPRTAATEFNRLTTDRWLQRMRSQAATTWPSDAIVFANCSAPLGAVRALGGFDESLEMTTKEDVELGLRLWGEGLAFRYCDSAAAYELYGKASRAFALDGETVGRADVAVARKQHAYRAHSEVAAVVALPRRRLRTGLARAAPVVYSVFAVAVAALERLGRFTLAVRVVSFWRSIAIVRGAAAFVGSWSALRGEFGVELPVLLYHRVGTPQAGLHPALTVAPERFEKQISWLARRGYTAIRSNDWLDWRLGRGTLPTKPILITFDDAYADLAEHALPTLDRHGFTGSVFVVTGLIGQANMWDPVDRPEHRRPLMNEAAILYWAGRGIEFGAHTRTHPDLTTLDESRIAGEVSGSSADLTALLGHRPTAFAYPYGQRNVEVELNVRKSFDLAFTTEEGLNHLSTPAHLLRRTMAQPNDLLVDLWFRARLGRSPLQEVRRRIRLRSRLGFARR